MYTKVAGDEKGKGEEKGRSSFETVCALPVACEIRQRRALVSTGQSRAFVAAGKHRSEIKYEYKFYDESNM